MPISVPDLDRFIARIQKADLQRSNLYFVRLPIGLMVSTALGSGANAALGQAAGAGIPAALPVNSVADQLSGAINDIPGPEQLKRLAANFGSDYTAEMLVKSVGTPSLDTESTGNQLDALRDEVETGVTAGTISLTMMCTPGAPEYSAFHAWMDQIQNHKTGRMGFRNEYSSGKNMEIQLLNRQLVPRAEYKFYDVRPTNVGPIQLSWESNNEVMEFNATLRFRTHEYNQLA